MSRCVKTFDWYCISLCVAGILSKGHVRCPWHGACFNIVTGDIEEFPGLDSLPTFQVTFLVQFAMPFTFPAFTFSLSIVKTVYTSLMSVCFRFELKRTK